VPFPLSRARAAQRCAGAGLTALIELGRRPSMLRRAGLYAVLATRAPRAWGLEGLGAWGPEL